MAIQDYSSETRREGFAAAARHESAPSISEAAGSAARGIRGDASKVAEEAQEKATAFLTGQKTAAADHLEGLSQPLHEAVDRMREKSPGLVSDYAQRAVDGLDSVAAALREQDLRSIARSVEDFARRQPAVFVAGSVAAGFVLARFLKSSSGASHLGGSEAARRHAPEYPAAEEAPVEKELR